MTLLSLLKAETAKHYITNCKLYIITTLFLGDERERYVAEREKEREIRDRDREREREREIKIEIEREGEKDRQREIERSFFTIDIKYYNSWFV